jgi:hypothetical protein
MPHTHSDWVVVVGDITDDPPPGDITDASPKVTSRPSAYDLPGDAPQLTSRQSCSLIFSLGVTTSSEYRAARDSMLSLFSPKPARPPASSPPAARLPLRVLWRGVAVVGGVGSPQRASCSLCRRVSITRTSAAFAAADGKPRRQQGRVAAGSKARLRPVQRHKLSGAPKTSSW